MGYEPKQRPGFDWVADMQRRMDAKTQKASADTASDNPRVRELAATWAELKSAGKVSEASEPKVKYEPGPLVREAEQVAEAVRKLKAGSVGQALDAVDTELLGLRDGHLGRVVLRGGA